MSKELADKLKAARQKLGISQAQAALKWGIPKPTLISWENDQRTPTGFSLNQLNEMLDGILNGSK